MFQQMIRQVYHAGTYSLTGKIENIVGMSIEASGGQAAVGDICRIYNGVSGKQVTAEVVGFKNNHMLLMPYSDMNGISAGSFVRNTGKQLSLRVGEFLRGRIINALGQPLDGKGAFENGVSYCYRASNTAEDFAGIFERFTDQELAVNWESGKIAGQAQVKTTESGGRLASWSWGSTRYTVYTASAISDEECTQVVTNLMELSYYE